MNENMDIGLDHEEALRQRLATHQQAADELTREIQEREARRAEIERNRMALETPLNERRIDYNTARFEWDTELENCLRRYFNFADFREGQRGVINAAMDGRNVVVNMSTGAGKSFPANASAILSFGCTFVVSPLLSLIDDQICHLRRHLIHAVQLTGSTSTEEYRNIIQGFEHMAESAYSAGERPIKICFVTPEKLARSPTVMRILQKLALKKKLARVVIDEAHCASQNADFRPDYTQLAHLRETLPEVPFLLLTATCTQKILDDLVEIFRLGTLTPGDDASRDGTVFFATALHRPNLHYHILLKHYRLKKQVKVLADWIHERHSGDTGIVYCRTKKETETLCKELQALDITCDFYHADRSEAAKKDVHARWNSGEIGVICATIAFGMGIDKANVRFVVHYTIAKSLDRLYQESGRAGRDGEDADCLILYRPHDIWQWAAMDPGRIDMLLPIVNFVLEKKLCYKVQFARYFTTPLSLQAWGPDALAPCRDCQNCRRPQVNSRNVTYQSWQLCKIIASGPRLTASQLANACCKGQYRSGHDNRVVDVESLSHGRVRLIQEEIEYLVVVLWTKEYLAIDIQDTSGLHNRKCAYLRLGPRGQHLVRLSAEDLRRGGTEIYCTFPTTVMGVEAIVVFQQGETADAS
ncbi:ATP-dependent DNA helicase [Hymenopellis radicata]|nr:ATP-dependent DNA helicase [Hymenopellis radicata]